MNNAWYYTDGKFIDVGYEHGKFEPVDTALDSGKIRVRKFVNQVSFQGRPEAGVLRAIDSFISEFRRPEVITAEWNGTYKEFKA